MIKIFETEHFKIFTLEKPHISRTDGGHIIIAPKNSVEDRTKLSPSEAKEMMKLTMLVGEAMKEALLNRGVEIGRINYQDNGNWKHELHIHLYGRAKNAVVQIYGAPLKFPTTREEQQRENFEPLNDGDVAVIRAE